MSTDELWNISPRSLFNKLRGFRKRENDSWERMRIQSWLFLHPYFPAEGQGPSPQDLFPLPWDEEIRHLGKVDVKQKAAEAAEMRRKQFAEIDEMKKRIKK